MTQFINFGTIPNGPGSSIRAGINAADIAEASQHAGESAPAVAYRFQYWRQPSTNTLYQRDASNTFWRIVQVYMTRNPGPTDSVVSLYQIGTMWVNTTTGAIWDCVDATAGAARWINRGEQTLSMVDGGNAATAAFTTTIDCGGAGG